MGWKREKRKREERIGRKCGEKGKSDFLKGGTNEEGRRLGGGGGGKIRLKMRKGEKEKK